MNKKRRAPKAESSHTTAQTDQKQWTLAIKKAARQFSHMLPMLAGVVLLVGLFNSFVSQEMLDSLFSGYAAWDTVMGTLVGSILSGNAVNSYVVGRELLNNGVSLFAVTAFIVSWATVGLIQLPVEMAALGRRFALLRTFLTFLLAMAVALLTVLILNLTGGTVS